MSIALEFVDKTGVMPPGHLKLAGQVISREPVASCVKKMLTV
jgi:hypothetical protein